MMEAFGFESCLDLQWNGMECEGRCSNMTFKGRRDTLSLVILTVNWAGILQGFVRMTPAPNYRAVFTFSERKEIVTTLAKGAVLKRLNVMRGKHDPVFP